MIGELAILWPLVVVIQFESECSSCSVFHTNRLPFPLKLSKNQSCIKYFVVAVGNKGAHYGF